MTTGDMVSEDRHSSLASTAPGYPQPLGAAEGWRGGSKWLCHWEGAT